MPVVFGTGCRAVGQGLTSSATTAKPIPASPARAASTAAFRANILVRSDVVDYVYYGLYIVGLANFVHRDKEFVHLGRAQICRLGGLICYIADSSSCRCSAVP